METDSEREVNKCVRDSYTPKQWFRVNPYTCRVPVVRAELNRTAALELELVRGDYLSVCVRFVCVLARTNVNETCGAREEEVAINI